MNTDDEHDDRLISNIEQLILHQRTHLAAALARNRYDNGSILSLIERYRLASKLKFVPWRICCQKTFVKCSIMQPSCQSTLGSIRLRRRKFRSNVMISHHWTTRCYRMNAVVKSLEEDEGWVRVASLDDVVKHNFCVDYHCPNLLIFHYSQKTRIAQHPFALNNHLYIQDKSSCLIAQSVRKLLTKKDNLCLAYVGGGDFC
jgi:hypothetical protein